MTVNDCPESYDRAMETTESKQDAILAELRQVSERLARFETLLARFQPLIDAYAGSANGSVGLMRMRKALKDGR